MEGKVEDLCGIGAACRNGDGRCPRVGVHACGRSAEAGRCPWRAGIALGALQILEREREDLCRVRAGRRHLDGRGAGVSVHRRRRRAETCRRARRSWRSRRPMDAGEHEGQLAVYQCRRHGGDGPVADARDCARHACGACGAFGSLWALLAPDVREGQQQRRPADDGGAGRVAPVLGDVDRHVPEKGRGVAAVGVLPRLGVVEIPVAVLPDVGDVLGGCREGQQDPVQDRAGDLLVGVPPDVCVD